MLMFFNPVALLIFRQLVQDDEQICDDVTVRLTGDPKALIRLLQLFEVSPIMGDDSSSLRERFEDRGPHDGADLEQL